MLGRGVLAASSEELSRRLLDRSEFWLSDPLIRRPEDPHPIESVGSNASRSGGPFRLRASRLDWARPEGRDPAEPFHPRASRPVWTAPSSRVPTRWATARRRHPARRFTKRLPGPPTARSPRFPARRAATRRPPTRRALPPEGFLAGRTRPPEGFRIRWRPIRGPNSTTPSSDKIRRSTMKIFV